MRTHKVLFHFGIISLTIFCGAIIFHVDVGFASSNNDTKQLIYGCEKYGGLTHCDRIPNDITSHSMSANSSRIFTSEDIPKIVTGKISGALKMDAAYIESVDIPHLAEYNTTKFSVSFWVKPTSVVESYSHVVSFTNNPPNSGWYFDMFTTDNGSKSFIRFNVANTAKKIFSSSDILVPNDDFINIVGTFNGSMIVTYANGKPVSQIKFTGTYNGDPGTPIRVGSGSWCSSCRNWSGILDDFRIYNNSLSSEEVNYVYSRIQNTTISHELVSYFPFDYGLEDHSIYRNDGALLTIIGGMAISPDGRLFFTQKDTGQIRVMKNSQVLNESFVSLDDYYVSWEQGLLGITLDPEFSDNHFLYLYYTSLDDRTGEIFNRVVRFTDKDNKGIDKTILLDKIFAENGYNSGGALAFGPDSKLYVTVGDATEHPFSQDLAIGIGKVLRINRDGSIPSDNPFPGSPVFTLGHRNIFGIAFDKSGNGIITENGDSHYDEINLIQKGGNYGYPLFQRPNEAPELNNSSDSIKPLRSYWNTIAPTQAIYYNGTKFPELNGKFLIGTFVGDIYALKLDDKNKQIVSEMRLKLDIYPNMPVVSLAESPDGEIYFAGYSIEKLDDIKEDTMVRTMNEIHVDLPQSFDIGDLKANGIQRTIDLSINLLSTPPNIGNYITMKLPSSLLTDVYKVIKGSSEGQSSEIKFSVGDSTADYTTVKIPLSNEKHQQIFIIGT
jgi:glucose/arabinose dehydrogenase